jgi:hypothetical protein
VSGGGVDLVRDGRVAAEVELVRNGMIARCLSDTISMVGAPGDVIDFGKDLRQIVGATLGPGDADALAQEMATIFARDARLDAGSIRVKVTAAAAGGFYAFMLRADARTTTGEPIPMLLLAVSAVTVDDIAQQTKVAT